MEEEIVEINGKKVLAFVKDISIRDGITAGRINVTKKLIGQKGRMYIVLENV